MSKPMPTIKNALFTKLNEASKEECKEILADLMIPECRTVLKQLLDCVAKKSESINLDEINSFNELIQISRSKYIPQCKKEYDIRGCLEEHAPIKVKRKKNN
jgi:hypothetical protein